MTLRLTLSMILILIPFLTMINAAENTSGKEEWDISGTWEASAKGGQIVVKVQQNGNAISGVAHHNHSAGSASYPFSGSIVGGNIYVSVPGGPSFTGHMISQNSAAGVVRTARGRQIPVHASRK